MARDRGKDLSVGALFALALIILAFTLMSVGGDSRIFSDRTEFRVVFPNTTGLAEGSPVQMSGVLVGGVDSIRLSPDPGESGIEVVIGVDKIYAERVREDSQAALRILQLLSGEKFVEITPGSATVPALESGALISPQQDPELLQQAAVAAENLSHITVSLKNILDKLESGEGLIGQMISDPEFGRDGLQSLANTVENLEMLTGDLVQDRGKDSGFLSRVLYDQTFAAKVDDLGLAIGRFAEVMQAIDAEQGAVGEMLREDGAGQQALIDLREAAGSMRRFAAGLESDESFVGRLVNDPQYGEALATDLRTMVGNLAEITDKINSGDGTMGALVNERALYAGLEQVVAGVNDSKFGRWLLRRYQKKGIKAGEGPAAQ